MKTKIIIITLVILLITIHVSTTTYAKYTLQKQIKLGNIIYEPTSRLKQLKRSTNKK